MKRKCMVALATIALLALVACGRQGQQDMSDVTDAGLTADADTYAYWTDSRWIYNEGVGQISRHALYLEEEVKGVDVEPDGEYDSHSSDYRTLGNVIYGLEGFYRQTQEGWERRYYISRYDGTNEEIMYWPVELPSPEEYGSDEFVVASFDVKEERELVLFLQGKQEESRRASCYLALHMTPEGEMLSVTDLYPAMQELGVKTGAIFEEAYVDGEGYYYLIPGKGEWGKGNDVNVLDPDGKIVGSMTPGEGYAMAKWVMKLPDGSAVFSWSQPENMYILMAVYDRERNASRTLLEERLQDCWLWTPARDGYLYYVDYFDELKRCDIRTGSVEDCMHFPQLGLEGDRRSPHLAQIIIGENGEPEVLGRRDGKTVICRLSTEKPETEALRLLSEGGFTNYIESCAASFSQGHSDCPVRLEYPEGDEDAYWERAMAELVSGKGADMYYVGLSEMRMLQGKGVLADLSELISEETLAALWPGVLERGTLDGQLVGILTEPWVETMMVSDEIWPGDHWTLQEALDVIEAHPQVRYPLIYDCGFDSYNILQWLVLRSLGDSPFLDLEEGSCDFDNPLFIRALEVAGACGKPVDFDDAQELGLEKDWVAMEMNMTIEEFCRHKNTLGEGYHVVGFPTEGESGTYFTGAGFLVVNRETEHAQEAAAFLEELLSYERQYSLWSPVRKDMLEDRVVEHDFLGEKKMVIEFGNGLMLEVVPGPEGDYRIGEFQAIMEKGVGRTADTGAIVDIIWEEAGNYFSGTRDAAAVAGIIQNRVQLYLKERQ